MILRVTDELEEGLPEFDIRLRELCVTYPSADDFMARCCRATGDFYESAFLDVIQALDLRGTFIDGGAHCGNHSVFFARFCKATSIIAIEVARDLIPILSRNLQRHGADVPCYVVHAAIGVGVGEKEEWASVGETGTNSGGRTAFPPHRCGGTSWAVPVLSLDMIVRGVEEVGTLDPVVLLKLDIEGAEAGALQGAAGIIMRDRPVITCETAGERNGKAGKRDHLSGIIWAASDEGYEAPVKVPTPTPSWMWVPK